MIAVLCSVPFPLRLVVGVVLAAGFAWHLIGAASEIGRPR